MLRCPEGRGQGPHPTHPAWRLQRLLPRHPATGGARSQRERSHHQSSSSLAKASNAENGRRVGAILMRTVVPGRDLHSGTPVNTEHQNQESLMNEALVSSIGTQRRGSPNQGA
eukprot:6209497-Pleurochrysis_carterae.AAC.2